jgi:hypothetical protein
MPAFAPHPVGTRLGLFTVIKLRRRGETHVLCRCDCGTEKLVRAKQAGGQIASCGCMRGVGLGKAIQVGARFGRLTVIEGPAPRRRFVRAICDCGTEKFVASGKWGKQQSCGCIIPEAVRKGTEKLRVPVRVPTERMSEAQVAEVFAGTFEVVGDCWEYSLRRNKQGYGQIDSKRIGQRKQGAHRVSLALFLGRPLELNSLHHCDNPPCIRPIHLYEGTQKKNMEDASSRGRMSKQGRHPSSKLTQQQVDDVVARYRPGQNQSDVGNSRELAAEYNISRAYVTTLAWKARRAALVGAA